MGSDAERIATPVSSRIPERWSFEHGMDALRRQRRLSAGAREEYSVYLAAFSLPPQTGNRFGKRLPHDGPGWIRTTDRRVMSPLL
jgi:hypothetical protein